ncbi:MAG: Rrf2 family transcriptional regulator [Oligoflexia bacterium]|nr:Rrf2 family transcriptional regulator [Oligoflexia bacterium]
MLRINKVSEYGILALGFIGRQPKAVSARQISEGLHLPYEITAKTLQRLKEAGFVSSTKGAHGGYKLAQTLSEISFAQVVGAIEGTVALMDCARDSQDDQCKRMGICEIQSGMQTLNLRIRSLLEETKLDTLMRPQ